MQKSERSLHFIPSVLSSYLKLNKINYGIRSRQDPNWGDLSELSDTNELVCVVRRKQRIVARPE